MVFLFPTNRWRLDGAILRQKILVAPKSGSGRVRCGGCIIRFGWKVAKARKKGPNVTFFKGKNKLLKNFKFRIPTNKRLFTYCILSTVED